MEPDGVHANDRDLAQRIIAGVNAFGDLQDRFRKNLEISLLGRCGRADGRSQEKAVEIASQVLSDCFARSPSLLEKWQGSDNLEAFLRTVAHNRLKSWWDSRDAAVEVNSDSRAVTEAEGACGHPAVDWEELNAVERALAAGVEAAMEQCPEGLVFLRLKGLHGVDQRALSGVWSHHEAQTSRRIKEAMSLIRSTAARHAAEAGVELEMGALQQALQANPAILLGAAAAPLDPRDAEALRELAAGRLERGGRDRLVRLMGRNAGALEFFAQLLNRTDEKCAVFARDPALDGLGARLAGQIRRSVEILRPVEVRDLVSPEMAGLFADALRAMAADGGTLWWLCPGGGALEAVFNPLEPEIAGRRQPLVSGIISLVLATSESVCVAAADAHRRHSAAIDSALGKSTRSMIAVPFRSGERVCGVLTAVRLGTADSFGPEDTAVMERQSRAMSVLFHSILAASICGEPV